MKRAVSAVAFAAVALGAWQLCVSGGLVSPATLAGPWELARALPKLLSPSGGLPDVASTAWASLLAFLLSAPLGLSLGVLAYTAGEAGAAAEFSLDFLRSVPATALTPAFLILFGLSFGTKVALGAFSSALVIALATLSGLRRGNPTRRAVASTLGLTGARRLLLVELPEAAPQFFLGLRAGVSLALILVVVAEMMIGSTRGLGKVISDMRYTNDVPLLYAAIFAAGVIGYAYNRLLLLAERRLLHWRDG